MVHNTRFLQLGMNPGTGRNGGQIPIKKSPTGFVGVQARTNGKLANFLNTGAGPNVVNSLLSLPYGHAHFTPLGTPLVNTPTILEVSSLGPTSLRSA